MLREPDLPPTAGAPKPCCAPTSPELARGAGGRPVLCFSCSGLTRRSNAEREDEALGPSLGPPLGAVTLGTYLTSSRVCVLTNEPVTTTVTPRSLELL